MGDLLRSLERKPEALRHCGSPRFDHFPLRGAVEGIVDLHRRKSFAIVLEHLVIGKVFGVEEAFPFLVAVAARAGVDVHGAQYRVLPKANQLLEKATGWSVTS